MVELETFPVGFIDDTPVEAAARHGWDVLARLCPNSVDGPILAKGKSGEYRIEPSTSGPRARLVRRTA